MDKYLVVEKTYSDELEVIYNGDDFEHACGLITNNDGLGERHLFTIIG